MATRAERRVVRPHSLPQPRRASQGSKGGASMTVATVGRWEEPVEEEATVCQYWVVWAVVWASSGL
jgi:hypothetical protein